MSYIFLPRRSSFGQFLLHFELYFSTSSYITVKLTNIKLTIYVRRGNIALRILINFRRERASSKRLWYSRAWLLQAIQKTCPYQKAVPPLNWNEYIIADTKRWLLHEQMIFYHRKIMYLVMSTVWSQIS